MTGVGEPRYLGTRDCTAPLKRQRSIIFSHHLCPSTLPSGEHASALKQQGLGEVGHLPPACVCLKPVTAEYYCRKLPAHPLPRERPHSEALPHYAAWRSLSFPSTSEHQARYRT